MFRQTCLFSNHLQLYKTARRFSVSYQKNYQLVLSLPFTLHAGPCRTPGLIPGSRFILDPDPDPGKLFSKPGSGSKVLIQNQDLPFSSHLFKHFHFHFQTINGDYLPFEVILGSSFRHFWSYLVAFGHFRSF